MRVWGRESADGVFCVGCEGWGKHVRFGGRGCLRNVEQQLLESLDRQQGGGGGGAEAAAAVGAAAAAA